MVANAGIAQISPLLSVTDADVDKIFGVKRAHAARQMLVQGPPCGAAGVGLFKIVGASSIVAFKSFQTLGIYSAVWV
ncbi:hypothetical protein V1505DRAFT_369856 [Lipomyces doorenjongii]